MRAAAEVGAGFALGLLFFCLAVTIAQLLGMVFG